MYIAYALQFIGQSTSSPHGISSAENRKCQTDRILSSSFLSKNWELTTKISRSVSHVLRNAGSFFMIKYWSIAKISSFSCHAGLSFLKAADQRYISVTLSDVHLSLIFAYSDCFSRKKKQAYFFSMVEYFIGLLLHFKQSSSKFLIASKSGFLKTLIHLQT